MSRRLLLPLAAIAACLLLPAGASAHALVVGTSPERGATLKAAPAQVEFDFSETVETDFGAIRVFNSAGDEVQSGSVFHPGGAGSKAAVKLKPGLPDGGYTATYRVISADSHPVSGGFVFSVGKGSAAGPGVTRLLAGSNSGPVTATAFSVVRAFLYAAIALLVGGLIFLAAAWRPGLRLAAGAQGPAWDAAAQAFEARLRSVLLIAACSGLLATVLALVLQAATATGDTFWAALNASTLIELLGTRFGIIWGAGAVAWIAVLTGLAARRRVAPALLALPAALLVAAPALAGHASTQGPVALLLPLVVIHVAAMSSWAGGLVAMLAAVPAATSRLEPAGRTRLLASLVTRFSGLALIAVATILVTGIAQAVIEVGSFPALVETAFGRAVLIKLVLLLVLIGIGVYQRRRVVPALERLSASGNTPGATGATLRRLLRTEVSIVAVVLIVTGALAGYSPANTASGPVAVTTSMGDTTVDLTVDPAAVGPNEMHIYLTDPQTGTPADAFKEFQVSVSLPDKGIGPLDADAEVTGPGHYTVPDAPFSAPGKWIVHLEGLVSKFEQQTGDAQVEIR
ncbi:MAG: copper transport protein [Thermoleophilaceae bacterium]|nr:copper transport protein [Thermoleophilaceae bacterium]